MFDFFGSWGFLRFLGEVGKEIGWSVDFVQWKKVQINSLFINQRLRPGLCLMLAGGPDRSTG